MSETAEWIVSHSLFAHLRHGNVRDLVSLVLHGLILPRSYPTTYNNSGYIVFSIQTHSLTHHPHTSTAILRKCDNGDVVYSQQHCREVPWAAAANRGSYTASHTAAWKLHPSSSLPARCHHTCLRARIRIAIIRMGRRFRSNYHISPGSRTR
jgi:hypothetical protein